MLEMIYGKMLKQVVCEVQTMQVGQMRQFKSPEAALCHTEVHQHGVICDVSRDQSRSSRLQKAKFSVTVNVDWPSTEEGLPVARTTLRTRHVTQQFIVVLRALDPAVTKVTGVQTRRGTAAPVEPWTPMTLASYLVLVFRAVVDTVTPEIDRYAEVVPWTLHVGLWTLHATVGPGPGKVGVHPEISTFVKVNKSWREIVH